MLLALRAAVLVLSEHDYVYPRLSPDGRRLAVARAMERADGYETTEVLLVDVQSGAVRELVSRREAEANETYETFVIGLRWLNDARVEVSLSDGDVGGTDIVVDAATGDIVETTHSEDGDLLVPSDLARVAADARFYSRHFSREELEISLGANGTWLDASRLLVQRSFRDEPTRPVFLIDARRRTIRQIANAAGTMELGHAIVTGGRIVFLLEDEGTVSVRSYDTGARASTALATFSTKAENDCARLEAFAGRTFVFLRPCTRSEPATGELWEIREGAAVRHDVAEQLDEFSAAADGSRIAMAVWENGKRIVRVLDGAALKTTR